MAAIGIDLGCLTTKIAVVGAKGLQIVRNDLAERLTPTLISYTDEERLIGDAALTSFKRNYASTVQGPTHLLGVTSADTELVALEQQYSFVPIVPEGDAGCVAYRLGETQVTAMEVLIPFIRKLKSICENYLGFPVSECVIATPVWFTEVHTTALTAACDLANFRCIHTWPHSHATALDYGLFRRNTFAETTPVQVVFLDVGYAHATCTIVEYTKKNCTILSSVEDVRLGGREVDRIILDHIIDAFNQKNGCEVRKSAKALLKLSETLEKAKKVLSANKEASIGIECLYNDYDLDMTLSREVVEKLLVDYVAGMHNLLARAAENVVFPDSTPFAIELVGSANRTPIIIQTIEAFFGKPVSRTVSYDECVAKGSAVKAAMLDARFHVANYEMYSLTSHDLVLNFPEGSPVAITDSSIPSNNGSYVVLPRLSKKGDTWSKRISLSLPSTPGFTFTVTHGSNIGTATVSLPIECQTAAKEKPESCTYTLEVSLLRNGSFLASASFSQQVRVTRKYTERTPKRNEEGEIIEGEFDEEEKTREETTYKTSKAIVNFEPALGFYNQTHIMTIRARESALVSRDVETQRARTARNEILTHCFKLRDILDGENEYTPFITPEDRKTLLAVKHECEEFAEYNANCTSEEYTACYQRLGDAFAPIQARHDESFRAAAAAAAAANSCCDESASTIRSDNTSESAMSQAEVETIPQ